ncbi:MAG: diguanylate cyclase [Thiomicrospira sp.]|uniref:diguanylate cyclase n=1 Tax=Thiomicrospira sp. TaxID=935 RepID=UPI0019F1B8BE|nr:diguanylate cyclase [Thiomicrospira sp.]MBE0493095.1 diguanylate cyclase [Thiomicrospira sp.]
MRKKVLVIDDQKAMGMLLKSRIEARFEVDVLLAHDLAQTQQMLTDYNDQIYLALSDLNLPDAPNGEAVKLLKKSGITTVVLTASYDEALRQRIFKEHVADYVLKEGAGAIEYVLRILNLLLTNDQREIWLANVSDRMARKLSGLLAIQRFKTRVFERHKELLAALSRRTPNLLVMGHANHDNNWLHTLSETRAKYAFYELPILACIETESDINCALKYMKYGATDYIVQPFGVEEFYTRVNQNIEQQQAYQDIKRISQTDALSGLYNRRYCLDVGQHQYLKWQSSGLEVFALLVDIDFFKRINDLYGHPKGDQAIVFVAAQLKQYFEDKVVARFGGEEFLVLGTADNSYDVLVKAENFRKAIELESDQQVGVSFSCSIGVAFNATNFEQLISQADQKLYDAKDQGRNQICHKFERLQTA